MEQKICEKCNDSGIIENENGSVSVCECVVRKEKEAKIKRIFQDSKIPQRYKDFNFDNLVLNKILIEEVKNVPLKEIKNSLFIFGNFGTGKTALAIAFLKYHISQGVIGLFISVPELLDRIRSAFDQNERYRADDVIEQAKKVELLVLDDLGAEKPTEWVKEKMFQIVNHRYNELLPTVFTSNLTLRELIDRIGERIVARIKEMATVVNLVGKDLREK